MRNNFDKKGGDKRSFSKPGQAKKTTSGRPGPKKSFDRRDDGNTPGGFENSRRKTARPSFNGPKPDSDNAGKKDFKSSKPTARRFAKDKDEKPSFRGKPDKFPDNKRKKEFKPKAGLNQTKEGEIPEYDFGRFKKIENNQNRFRKEKIKPSNPDEIRLNRYIANAGVCSRRDADELIAQGEIKVNGKVVTELGFKVQPGDVVKYGSKTLNREKLVYVLLNKPKDFITTTNDPEERKTVMQLVSNACKERIYPVGRLDRNTTGLLLFTNDGELAEKLSHPSNQIRKIYQVSLDKPLDRDHFEKIMEGITLEDGFVKVDEIATIGLKNEIGVEIHSGKNRIVRRIFEHFGYEVIRLDRVLYAGLDKKDLPRGNWRFLTEKEVIQLKYFR